MATSRSKEKVSAALRKFFSPENKNKNTGNEESTSKQKNNSGATASTSSASASASSMMAASSVAAAAIAGPSTSSSSAAVNSPSKRLRCGIAPAASGPTPIHCASSNAGNIKPASKNAAPSPLAATFATTSAAAAAAAATAAAATAAASAAAASSSSTSVAIPPPAGMSIRARRLMKEFHDIQKLMRQPKPVFSVQLLDDNLFEWMARLYVVDPESPLARDMLELGVPHIELHLSFPANFPFAPPFMRVVEPRIEKGYVMEGGAICMELLTPRGWASAYTVEALLMQFSASVVKGRGRIVRHQKIGKQFNRQTAELAFRSLVKTHDKYGWVTPALSDG